MSDTIYNLIKQIAERLSDEDQNLIAELEKALDAILTGESAETSRLKRDPTSGCYQIEGDPARYCPHCYEKDQQQIATQRINSKLRVCQRCRSSIKPQK